MPLTSPLFRLGLVCALAGAASGLRAASPAPVEIAAPGAAFATPVQARDLDPEAFVEWENGTARALGSAERPRPPSSVLWTTTGSPGGSATLFGDSKIAGPRHLRIGFRTPVRVGSVLALGGGRLSVLKPGAAYPGDPGDESQWLAATRAGVASAATVADAFAEAGADDYALWVLPPGVATRALRFTHVAAQTDLRYAGAIAGALVLEARWDNLAPFAQPSASANNQWAPFLINGRNDRAAAWTNQGKNQAEPAPGMTEWTVLAWPAPVTLDALVALGAAFSAAEVQTYVGPEGVNPRDADERAWTSLGTFSGVQAGNANQLWPNRLAFGREVTTRAVRLRLNPPSVAAVASPRVALAELLALRGLGVAAPAERASAPAAAQVPPPPIPVRFTLEKPGYVSLVIERPDGVRVRNLIADTLFPAGDNTAWWDGTDDLGRDVDAAMHGVYNIPARFVEPGAYRVRGLVRGEVKAFYEFSTYATGNPPWNTADFTGAWLANHTPPQAALFVPAKTSPTGEDAMFLGCFVTEGPAGLAWTDLEGKKLGGKRWIGGHWTAAPYLARDAGAKALPGDYAYVASVWETAKASGIPELRITALTKGEDRPVLLHRLEALATGGHVGGAAAKAEVDVEIGGLAARDGIVVVALAAKNELLFVDARDGKILGTHPIPAPRAIAFDAQGRLLALTEGKLLRFSSIKNAPKLPAPQTLIASGLEEPMGLTLSDDGRIFISDRGRSHQVKVFAANGRFLRAIGKPGVPQAGPYDPLRLQNPAGLAVDSRGRLWVTEKDFLPKRVSVWSLEGELLKAFYGPGKYGGGGTLDPRDRTRFYYADDEHGAMEFKVDWEKGAAQLAQVYYRPGEGDLKLPFRSSGPETPLYHEGRRYFTNCYNSHPTGGAATAFLFVERDGLARPAAAMGRAIDWALLKGDAFAPRWPAGVNPAGKNPAPVFFIWSDRNEDAQVQPDEVAFEKAESGGVTVMPDLSFCVARVGDRALRFSPADFSATGTPRYAFERHSVLASGVLKPASSGGDQVLASPDGWAVVTLGVAPFESRSLSGTKDGVARWSYPSPWPGLHASHRAPQPDRPGQLIGTTRLLGGFFEAKGSDAGPLWGINSNHGRISIFTRDGLLAATLFEDMRQGKIWRMPSASRNMSLEGVTLGEENFWPMIASTSDGRVYLVDGARSALVRLDGLETIRRLPDADLVLTEADLERSRAWQVDAEARRQRALGGGVLKVSLRSGPVVVDGRLDDWAGADWVDIDKSGVSAYFSSQSRPYDVTAAVAVAGDRLYAAWRTGNDKLLENSGDMPVAPFKTGGALDLMLGVDPKAPADRRAPAPGDLRLLVTIVQGEPRAVLYRAVVPGTRDADKVPFSSPWRTVTFDKVEDVSGRVRFAAKDGDYEVSVPLSELGLKPAPELTVKGDIGILRGNGTETTARIYWHNKATGIVSDVPAEAMLTPALWGEFKFVPR